MCLILLAYNIHPEYKLVLAANRDEYFDRPTLAADFWKENDIILGGRDIKSGGTWLGLTKNGRFIAITNYRDFTYERENTESRGELSKKFLLGDKDVVTFLSEVSENKDRYNGFNLIVGDRQFDNLYHYSNINNHYVKIGNGIHGLSNHLLDTPWPKITYGKTELVKFIQQKSNDPNKIFEILKNGEEAADNNLPSTGISFDLEKKLSPVFISMKGYGTRCSTVIFVDYQNNLSFWEVTYNQMKQITSEKVFNFELKS